MENGDEGRSCHVMPDQTESFSFEILRPIQMLIVCHFPVCCAMVVVVHEVNTLLSR